MAEESCRRTAFPRTRRGGHPMWRQLPMSVRGLQRRFLPDPWRFGDPTPTDGHVASRSRIERRRRRPRRAGARGLASARSRQRFEGEGVRVRRPSQASRTRETRRCSDTGSCEHRVGSKATRSVRAEALGANHRGDSSGRKRSGPRSANNFVRVLSRHHVADDPVGMRAKEPQNIPGRVAVLREPHRLLVRPSIEMREDQSDGDRKPDDRNDSGCESGCVATRAKPRRVPKSRRRSRGSSFERSTNATQPP